MSLPASQPGPSRPDADRAHERALRVLWCLAEAEGGKIEFENDVLATVPADFAVHVVERGGCSVVIAGRRRKGAR